jgi:hypothetical protein
MEWKKLYGMNNVTFKERRDNSPYRAVTWKTECSAQPHLECLRAMAVYAVITHIRVFIFSKNKSFNEY